MRVVLAGSSAFIYLRWKYYGWSSWHGEGAHHCCNATLVQALQGARDLGSRRGHAQQEALGRTANAISTSRPVARGSAGLIALLRQGGTVLA